MNNSAAPEDAIVEKILLCPHPLYKGGGPGQEGRAGLQLAPRLMVAFGSDRAALTDPSQMQKKSGIAPVLDRSSQSQRIHGCWCRSKFLCQTFHEFAALSIPHSSWAKAYYEELTARGKSHHTAVRALAFKWIRIIFRLWQDRTTYDEERYLQALKKRRSPLSPKIHLQVL